MNPLMKSYLTDFELYDQIIVKAKLDYQAMKDALPEKLSDLLDRPLLRDPDRNFLINIESNKKLATIRKQKEDYYFFTDQTGYEYENNKINLWEYSPDMNKYYKDHELWAERFLTHGLYFSLLLFDILDEDYPKRFMVIFTCSISKTIEGAVRFHTIRRNEHAISVNFEREASAQGIMTINSA